MKYLSLLAYLFIFISPISYGMEIEVVIPVYKKDESNYNILCSSLKLLKEKSTTEMSTGTPFCIYGVAFDDLAMIRAGIKMGADINYRDSTYGDLTFIQIACKEKNADIVAELLKAPNININAYAKDTHPAFHYAVERKDKEIINLLIAHDPEAVNIGNINGNTCLHNLCSENNQGEMLEFLFLQKTINPNISNNRKDTPLHMASSNGFTDYIKLLLSYKADTHAQDICGQTPFFNACISGDIESVKLLLPANTQEINKRDYHGDTPLHIACNRGHATIAEFLLKNGACPTIKNNVQCTPLAEAAFECDNFNAFHSPSLKKLLLKKDKHGNTQLHLAALITDQNYNDKLDNYLSFLIGNGLSVWTRNKKNQLPVERAYKEHTALCKEYMTKKRRYLYDALDEQEMVMHAFLRLTSAKIECVLFTTMLKNYLPDDLYPSNAYYYYALNIETIIAKKYKCDQDYYDDFIENKNAIKQKLCNNLEDPHLLWS